VAERRAAFGVARAGWWPARTCWRECIQHAFRCPFFLLLTHPNIRRCFHPYPRTPSPSRLSARPTSSPRTLILFLPIRHRAGLQRHGGVTLVWARRADFRLEILPFAVLLAGRHLSNIRPASAAPAHITPPVDGVPAKEAHGTPQGQGQRAIRREGRPGGRDTRPRCGIWGRSRRWRALPRRVRPQVRIPRAQRRGL
jgi:hypothetical protein